ncbi:unnamed protein product [Sphagnum compactum]
MATAGMDSVGKSTHLVENLATKPNHDSHARGMLKGKALVPQVDSRPDNPLVNYVLVAERGGHARGKLGLGVASSAAASIDSRNHQSTQAKSAKKMTTIVPLMGVTTRQHSGAPKQLGEILPSKGGTPLQVSDLNDEPPQLESKDVKLSNLVWEGRFLQRCD